MLRSSTNFVNYNCMCVASSVWSPAAAITAIASLLRLDAAAWTQRERAAYGIETVFRSRILRSDQGGYGSFTPAAVVPPEPERPTSAVRLGAAGGPRSRR